MVSLPLFLVFRGYSLGLVTELLAHQLLIRVGWLHSPGFRPDVPAGQIEGPVHLRRNVSDNAPSRMMLLTRTVGRPLQGTVSRLPWVRSIAGRSHLGTCWHESVVVHLVANFSPTTGCHCQARPGQPQSCSR